MGIFTSKIAIGILAGGFTLAGAGLLFTGSDTLSNASTFVSNAGERLMQYDQNEDALKGKIGVIKTNANSKISTANVAISGLETDKATLSTEIVGLNTEIEGLNTDIAALKVEIEDLKVKLATEKTDHVATKKLLSDKTKEYNAKVAQLNITKGLLDVANKANAALIKTLAELTEQAVKADKLVAELEGEIQQANEEVAAHGAVVEAVKATTETAQPSTQAEIDAIDITLDEVVIGGSN